MSKAFTRHVLVGTNDCGNVFVTIQWDGKRLSITGVEGPRSNGDARGSCGQIDLARVTTPAVGIDVAKLAELWARWHLNDMRADCEHQRRDWDVSEKIEVVTYKLTTDASRKREALKAAKLEELSRCGRATATEEEVVLLSLPYESKQPPTSQLSFYEIAKRELKSAGWVRPNEHPKGLLGRPCPQCGYRYGTKWLHEDVPKDVLAFLKSLPMTDALPACWARD